MVPLKDLCSSMVANYFALPILPLKHNLLTSIAIAAMSRYLPAITRSNWHNDGESWYRGRWFGIKFTIIPRIALEYSLFCILKKQGHFSCSVEKAFFNSAFSRIIIGTYFLEPIVRFVASSILFESKFKWFERKFLVSPEQARFSIPEDNWQIWPPKLPEIDWKKRVILELPILPAEINFIPLPLQGMNILIIWGLASANSTRK